MRIKVTLLREPQLSLISTGAFVLQLPRRSLGTRSLCARDVDVDPASDRVLTPPGSLEVQKVSASKWWWVHSSQLSQALLHLTAQAELLVLNSKIRAMFIVPPLPALLLQWAT